MNLSGSLVENAGEHSPIRIPDTGNKIVYASFMQVLEEAKSAPEYVGEVGAFTPEAQDHLCFCQAGVKAHLSSPNK